VFYIAGNTENTAAVIIMRAPAALPLLVVLAAVPKPATSCVELQGVVPGGGEGLLDLTFLLSDQSLGIHPLAPLDTLANPAAVSVR